MMRNTLDEINMAFIFIGMVCAQTRQLKDLEIKEQQLMEVGNLVLELVVVRQQIRIALLNGCV